MKTGISPNLTMIIQLRALETPHLIRCLMNHITIIGRRHWPYVNKPLKCSRYIYKTFLTCKWNMPSPQFGSTWFKVEKLYNLPNFTLTFQVPSTLHPNKKIHEANVSFSMNKIYFCFKQSRSQTDIVACTALAFIGPSLPWSSSCRTRAPCLPGCNRLNVRTGLGDWRWKPKHGRSRIAPQWLARPEIWSKIKFWDHHRVSGDKDA